MIFNLICLGVASAAVAAAHGDHTQEPIAGPHKSLWYNSLPGDGGTQVHFWPMNIGGVSSWLHYWIGLQADSVFSGISTFGRLPYFPCLASDEEKFDIAFLGRGLLVYWWYSRNWGWFVLDRCTIRYRDLLSTWRSLRSFWNTSRFSASQSVVRFLPTGVDLCR